MSPPRPRRRRGGAGRGGEARAARDGEATVRLKGVPSSPHPWMWRSRIASADPRLEPGEVVRVVDGEGRAIGRGLYHPHVTIALRLLTRDPEERIDQAYFARRLASAAALRHDRLRLPETTDAYRLLHAEADGVSGLVVDVLGGVVRAELYARGIARLEPELRAALAAMFPGRPLVVRGDRRAEDIEGFRIAPRAEDPEATEVVEQGVRFHVDLRLGHKTGFFCDQRDNRAFLASLVRGRSVLDAHTYSGGFALYAALKGQAASVTGVDLDEKAVAVAKRNAKLNQLPQVRFAQADAFAYLRDLLRAERRPEVLVLDPPKLARDLSEKEEGLRTYADLNRLGLETLADDGLLLTCSCSGVVTEQDLLEVLRGAAARTRKEVTLLRIAGAGADHPVALHIPESGYLKAVFARVRAL